MRRLHLEKLEDRRLLAVVAVDNNLDIVNGVTTSIAELIDTPGADGISLREAITAANNTPGADIIEFNTSLSGETITLGGTEIEITEALTIDARLLDENVTIDANQESRIFNITATTGDFMLGGLTLTGGRTTADGLAGRGGAIRSLTDGELTLDQSAVSGNSTAGDFAHGGGIYASGAVTLTQSTVSGNSTAGSDAYGGGIRAFDAVTLTQSTVSGNSTMGGAAFGGGIYASFAVTLTESTVSGNSTAGFGARGGGISASSVTLNQSTVSGNSTAGFGAHGGGIRARDAVTLTQSTVSGNSTAGDFAYGGGVFQRNSAANHPFSISGSIVAGNTAGGGGNDLMKDPESTLTVNYSLIGDNDGTPLVEAQTADANGNLIGHSVANGGSGTIDPMLGPLADNGGPTLTHAVLAGSPAIDAGDPSIVFNPAQFDQRGAPFARVFGSRIDIGAFESQPLPSILFGDYNQDGTVDAADYTVWRDTLGSTTELRANGDNTGASQNVIDAADYTFWKQNFGNTTVSTTPAPVPAAFAAAVEQPSAETTIAQPVVDSVQGRSIPAIRSASGVRGETDLPFPGGRLPAASSVESAPPDQNDLLLLLVAGEVADEHPSSFDLSAIDEAFADADDRLHLDMSLPLELELALSHD